MLKSSVFKRLDMNLMSRLSIRQRMIVLVSLTMLGFAIVGAIVWVNGARTERAFAETRHFDEVAESILKIKPSVVDMQRLQETFLAERKPQFAAAFRAVAETAEAELESIQSRTTSDEISLEQTIGSFARYLVLFDQVVAAQEKLGFNIEVVANVKTGEGFSHAQNMQVVIDNAAHKLEKRFKEELEFEESPVIFGLLVRLYETRRTERKLLARGDQDQVALLMQQSGSMKLLLDKSGLDEAVKAEIKKALVEYDKALKAWVEGSKELQVQSRNLRKFSIQIQSEFDTLAETAKLGAVNAAAMLDNAREQTARLMGFSVIGSMLLVLLISFAIGRSIIKPLGRLTNIMKDLAEGDLSVSIAENQSHEMGAMADAVVVFRDNAVEQRELRKNQQSDVEAREERQRNVEEMIESFRGSIVANLDSLGVTAEQMDVTARSLADIAGQTREQATAADSASDGASTNVGTVASATEELSSSIGEINSEVAQTSTMVTQATQAAQAANEKVRGLTEAANKIGEVINMIQDIAKQTNLLALNATIEAARAGEMGKGFAVVANEVKTLADQTSKATDQISGHIHAIQDSTTDAATAIEEIAQAISDVNGRTQNMAAAVEEQGSATGEISRSIQEAARGTKEVAASVSGMLSSVDQTNQSADYVLQASQDLSQKSQEIRTAIEGFLTDVAAA